MTSEGLPANGKTIGGPASAGPAPRRSRVALVNVILVLASVALTSTVLEIFFRVTDTERYLFPMVRISDNASFAFHIPGAPPEFSTILLNRFSTTVTYTYPDDPRGYFGDRNTVESRINSRGFRGPEFERKKGGNVFRVAFLGDSFTLGQGVKFEDTYPQAVSAAVTRRDAGSRVRIESYNFGVGGGNLINSFHICSLDVFSTVPDMVVLGLTLNDVEPTVVMWNTDGNVPVPVRNARALDFFEGAANWMELGAESRLATCRILFRALNRIRRSAKTVEYYRALYGQGNSGWRDRNLQALEAIAERCSKHRIPFRVLILPVFYRFDDYPFEEIHAFLRGFLEDRGIEYVDLLDSFRGMRHEDLWVHRVDPHPNEKAHAIIAGIIVEKVIDPALLPRRPVP
jgi:hypothetical protein